MISILKVRFLHFLIKYKMVSVFKQDEGSLINLLSSVYVLVPLFRKNILKIVFGKNNDESDWKPFILIGIYCPNCHKNIKLLLNRNLDITDPDNFKLHII